MNIRNPNWKVPENCRAILISGGVDPNDTKYRRLLDLLLHNERQWTWIHLKCQHDHGSSSPAFLALMDATLSKTNMLHLNDCMIDVPSFHCLNCGLAGAHELKRITLEHSQPFTDEQMSVFAEGLSQTKNLDYLSLKSIDLRRPQISDALAAGLEANDSLSCLNLTLCLFENDCLSRVLVALQGHSKLNRLEILYGECLSQIEFNSIRDWLSRNDCMLEHLSLREQYDITLRDRSRQFVDAELGRSPATSAFGLGTLERQNRSVIDLQLERMAIESSMLQGVLSNFANLISLDLSLNKVSDLQPLDILLTGANCSLETLILTDNPISVTDILIFARKLPRMKVLRNLEFSAHHLLQDMDSFNEFGRFLVQNTCLERVSTVVSGAGVVCTHPKVLYGTSMNRAARRYFRRSHCDSSLELFPSILARVAKIRYYDTSDKWGEPTRPSNGFDAIFWLLRENSTFLSGISSQRN